MKKQEELVLVETKVQMRGHNFQYLSKHYHRNLEFSHCFSVHLDCNAKPRIIVTEVEFVIAVRVISQTYQINPLQEPTIPEHPLSFTI